MNLSEVIAHRIHQLYATGGPIWSALCPELIEAKIKLDDRDKMIAAMKRIIREAGMAKKSQWITRADAIEHIMRLARYAEEALPETDRVPVASAGAPESLPPNAPDNRGA